MNSPSTAPTTPVTAATSPHKNLLARLTLWDWLILICLAGLFAPLFLNLYELWTLPDQPQSYGLLVLPASLLLAWMLRSRLQDVTPRASAWGLAAVVPGLGLLLIGTLAAARTVSALGFIAVVTGVVWTRYGGDVTRRLWFPLAFLLALVPFPTEILNLMTFPLQRLSIQWAALLLKPFGDVTVEGTQLHLGSYTLNVIAPCSGLTIVLPLLVLAVYYLYIIDGPFWKKAFLTALTFPVAMIVNAVRVALIGVVGEAMGAGVAAAFHDYSGLITVVLGFAVLIFIAKEMRCHQLSDEIVF
jgi:exosortase